ncbi:MAG: hypothetical protein COV29_00695 [Candidatus Yanofskybacteria bacterium CG10_big_fil_rev_8_21_14_0_10_36_16]|uniref:Dipeptidylpeptidase IV N-terminal domain-containing protein n=1 Tax=Candidatus Yanofskybacteria bacterium CG10_big_fil_rev_8_21_14_0_10_36_16 TaxID=1975096 RepID=A0A2J0Q8G2_9BACT|nr:MAG: hypothetical protein COV29_00695 [Candidatus Yanofskybacteria bacterium CG10_big_fil_rev_8_21_14_0_10_36_16]
MISLDISNAGDIVYALTDSQTDYADLYIRESDGDERLIRNNENDVTVWTRWSPDGQKIAFLKFTSVQDGGIWLINSDGSNIKRVSDVNWNYPPIWSHNGKKILFASGANIFEYDTEQNNLESKTSFISGFVKQPNYAVGEDVVVFSRDFNQESQIWSTDINRITKQLTETKQLKTYPVMVYEINE